MKKGTKINYRITLHGIQFYWDTEITRWNYPAGFTDTQIKGPYKIWIHNHLFKSDGTGTIVKDIVTYIPKGGIFEPVIHSFFVRKKLEHIFDYRENKIKSIFK